MGLLGGKTRGSPQSIAESIELKPTLPLDRGPGAAEALPALLADQLGSAERLVQLVGSAKMRSRPMPRRSHAVKGSWSARPPAPSGEIPARAARHRGCRRGRRRACRHCRSRPRGPHGESWSVYWLASAEMRGEFARLRKKRCECIRAERLEFVDVGEERHALLRRQRAALHGDELQVRDEKRAEQDLPPAPLSSPWRGWR